MRPHVEKVLVGEYDLPACLELREEPATVLDIGANVGAFTAWARAKWPAARIVAFEPVPAHGETWRLNHGEDLGASLNAAAVMGFASESLAMYPGADNGGSASAFDLGEQRTTESFRAPSVDAGCLPACEMVKIDAEGAEAHILRRLDLGAARMVAYEWHGADRREECEDLMLAREFELVRESQMDETRGVCVWTRPGVTRLRQPRPHPPGAPKRIMVGLPVYGGYDAHFVTSLMTLWTERIPVPMAMKPWIGDSLVSRARNNIAAAFLRSDATHLLFLDTDLIFSAAQIARLVGHDEPVVAGLYPKKQRELGWVCNLLPGAEMDERGLKPVRYAGTGCLLIAREVFEAMIARWPEIEYEPDAGESDGVKWDLFPVGVFTCPETGRRRYLSEDWWFCQRALDCGYKVWMDTQVVLKHVGQMIYPVDRIESFADPAPASHE